MACRLLLVPRSATPGLSLVAEIAVPIVSRTGEVSVWRYLDRHKRVAVFPETAVAFPAVAETVEIGIRGYFDYGAGSADFLVTSIALPSAAVTYRMRIGRRVYRIALGRSHARPTRQEQHENEPTIVASMSY
jgi:hypothetical protein